MRQRSGFLSAAAASTLLVASITTAQTFSEFPVGEGTVVGIAAGPDGKLWFTEQVGNTSRIGRITRSGVVELLPTDTSAVHPLQITAGSGAMWFTDARAIGRISVDGVVTEFPLPETPFDATLVNITSGPDGSIWYTLSISRVGRLTEDGAFREFETHYNGLSGITQGPDGNIWFLTSAGGESKICRITADGVIAQFGAYGELESPQQIVAGPDGNLWFTQDSSRLGRITTNGTITQFDLGTVVSSIAAWNGDLWVADGKRLLRVTTEGVVSGTVMLPLATGVVTAMTIGPDGELWLVDAPGAIARVSLQSRRRAVRH